LTLIRIHQRTAIVIRFGGGVDGEHLANMTVKPLTNNALQTLINQGK